MPQEGPDIWINHKERFSVPKKHQPPQIDPEVSKIVGKNVSVRDPRLIAFMVKKNKERADKGIPESINTNLKDPKNQRELRRAFGVSND